MNLGSSGTNISRRALNKAGLGHRTKEDTKQLT